MRSQLARYRYPAMVFTTVSLLLAALQHVSNRVMRQPHYSFLDWQGLHQYLDGWKQFDGHEYVKIAEHGYWYIPGQRSPIVWFPLYPMVVRAVHQVLSDTMIAGMVVTVIAGFAAAMLYWRWLGGHGLSTSARPVAFLALMLYPNAWYLYGPVHSDALFLALLIGACLLIDADRMVLAGLVGALATATRPTGMAVIPGLVVLGLEHDGVLTMSSTATGIVERFRIPLHLDRSRVRAATFAPALSALGLGGYMTYLGIRFGDPIAFINNQRVYHPGDLPLLKRAFFVVWRDSPDWTLTLTLTAQACFALLVVCCVPFVGRRFGWGYGVFVAVLVAIPTFSTEDFMGTGRYLIAAFPVAALIGEWLADRRAARVAWFSIATVALLGMNMAFSRSWYLT